MKTKKSILIKAIIVMVCSITIFTIIDRDIILDFYLKTKKEQRIKKSGYDEFTYNQYVRNGTNITSIENTKSVDDYNNFNDIFKYFDIPIKVISVICIIGCSLIILLSLVKPFTNKFIPSLKKFVKQIYD